jgi:hypothetical protein
MHGQIKRSNIQLFVGRVSEIEYNKQVRKCTEISDLIFQALPSKKRINIRIL